MNKITGLNFLLTGSLVVADDVKKIELGQYASADLIRRVSTPTPLPASATEAVSATTAGTNYLSRTLSANALPPGVTELKFSEFSRQSIGLPRLERQRIRILGYRVRQSPSGEAGGDAINGHGVQNI